MDAAIGVRIRRWVTYHGISLNIAPNLDHYQGIVACGIRGFAFGHLNPVQQVLFAISGILFIAPGITLPIAGLGVVLVAMAPKLYSMATARQG